MGSLLARDVMESRVVTVTADAPLSSIFRMFYEEEISGAPVVNGEGQVVGVVSMSDLIRAVQEDHEAFIGIPSYYEDARMESGPDWLEDVEEFEDRASHQTVGDVMTTDVVSVRPDTPIPDVAKKILKHRIHRVLVVDEKREGDNLAGIISLFDLVALLG